MSVVLSKLKLYPFLVPFVVAIAIQLIKIIIDVAKYKKFRRRQIFSAWGFPSVHSWISASVITLVYFVSWPGSVLFAVVLVFSFLFIYDAMNLRYEAGKHAHYLNSLRIELKDVLDKAKVHQYLKERLWHTPSEVIAGILIGILFTILLCKLFHLW